MIIKIVTLHVISKISTFAIRFFHQQSTPHHPLHVLQKLAAKTLALAYLVVGN